MIKALTLKFFSAFAKPAHVELEDPIPLEEQQKAWKIVLSQRTVMQKVEEAKKIQPEVKKEMDEKLKRNEALMGPFLDWLKEEGDLYHMLRPDHPDKKWRVKE